jgi:uncharacterized membrane protein
VSQGSSLAGLTAKRPAGVDTSALASAGRRSPLRAARTLVGDPTVTVVAVLTVATFVLRLTQIHQGLFGDETFTFSDIVGKSLAQVVTNVHTGAENSPPLFFIFAFACAKLGDPAVWIRLPSVFFGAAILPVIYLIGRDTVGRVPGAAAAAIVALSPFSMYYGVEARPYATMAFFTAVSTWALIRAVNRGDRRWWALYVVAAALACYSHYTCAFVLVVQGGWSLWACRDRLRMPLLAHALVLVLYIPWLPYLRGKALAVIGFLEPLTAHNVVIDATRTIAGYPYAPLRAIPTYLGMAALIACAVVGLGLLTRAAAAGGGVLARTSWPRHFWLLVALALANPVLLLIYSKLSTDLWLARNLYASMPAQALVLATMITAPNRRVAVVLSAVVAAVLAVGLARSLSPSWERPPYRSLASYLDRAASPADPVYMASWSAGLSVPDDARRPHHWQYAGSELQIPPGATRGFVIRDSTAVSFARIPKAIKIPRGWVLIKRIRYPGAVIPGTEVLVYRRQTATR